MKAKAKVKDNRLLVKVKVSGAEELNENELEFFSKRAVLGLLKPVKKRKRLLEYCGPAGISLAERLKKPMSSGEFFLIMAQICELSRKIKANRLIMSNVLMQVENIYINELTRELMFLYLPLNSIGVDNDILALINQIVYSVRPEPNQSSEFISNFAFFLRGLESFDEKKMESYIASVDRNAVNSVKRSFVGGMTENEVVDESYYNCDTDLLGSNDLEYEEWDDEGENTGILEEAFDDTTALNQDEGAFAAPSSYASLLRVLTNELIPVDKPVFRLGKERSYVDYFVSNNAAVSRSHANIVVRGGKFYVSDLNSKNRTYINGQALQPNVETEIFDGDTLRLANEEFIFKK